MSDYLLLSLKDSCKWNEYVGRLPLEQQDIYFTPEYYRLYEDKGDGKTQCFIFEKNGNIALYPFLLNSINDLGYDLDEQYFDIQSAYGYNGVLSSSYDHKFISSFYSAFNKYILSNNVITEFTRFHPIIRNESFSDMSIIEDKKLVYLDITKEYDFIWNNCYSNNNRNMIRKASKYNISISTSTDNIDYLKFFEIYTQNMRDVGSAEYFYFPERYFTGFKTLLSNHHKLILAKVDGEIGCAAILLFWGKYAHYHLSCRVKKFSGIGINNLILDEGIKIAQKEGYSFLHFGGGTTNMENDTLLRFKSNFSKDRATFYIGKKIYNGNVYDEIITQWSKRFPEKGERYRNFILKYRY